jgi:hypothetical protein
LYIRVEKESWKTVRKNGHGAILKYDLWNFAKVLLSGYRGVRMFWFSEFCKRERGRTRLPENAGKVLLSHRYAAVIWLNGQPISGKKIICILVAIREFQDMVPSYCAQHAHPPEGKPAFTR